MSDEDMLPKSPEVLREELNELVKEAKQKIKPVLMTKMEQEKYILTKDEASKRDLINIDIRSNELLETENITLEILRKIQDKKYEIDIKYEQTRDLYEKQRVVD